MTARRLRGYGFSIIWGGFFGHAPAVVVGGGGAATYYIYGF